MRTQHFVDACRHPLFKEQMDYNLSKLNVSGAVWTPDYLASPEEFSNELYHDLSEFLSPHVKNLEPRNFQGVFMACVLLEGDAGLEFPCMYDEPEAVPCGGRVVGCALLSRCPEQMDGRLGVELNFLAVDHESPMDAKEVLIRGVEHGLMNCIHMDFDPKLVEDFVSARHQIYLVTVHDIAPEDLKENGDIRPGSYNEVTAFLYFMGFIQAETNWGLAAAEKDVFERKSSLSR